MRYAAAFRPAYADDDYAAACFRATILISLFLISRSHFAFSFLIAIGRHIFMIFIAFHC